MQAAGRNGESYETPTGRSAITLISSDELEYRVDSNTTLLCKYTDQGDALRVVVTMLGTQQVMYFRRVPNGLMSNDGDLYLNRAGLAELRRQEQLEEQRQMEAQATAARERAERERLEAIAAHREAEAQRAAEERAKRALEAKNAEIARSIVGTWRDENSVATYSADGTYTLRGDNGTTAKARWWVEDGEIVRKFEEWNGKPTTATNRMQILSIEPSAMTLREQGHTWHNVRVE